MNIYQNLAFPLTMNNKKLNAQQVTQAVEEALDAVGLLNKINQIAIECLSL